ncbi:cell polarity protein [Ophiostoma piceae UAMH 11346]|uniref:Cell polarity protein n=1 Tax=Ophiostoma piceae (strain UAMH 11346) TaxID=1262450 RepID=S3BTQ6_OPHP1|nr:cell polarity protein [Ophiostoma piceae UAMH 11346]
MNSRNAPLSPVSIGDSDWPTNGYSMAKDDPYANNRGQLISPPNSGGALPSPGPGPMSGMNFPNGPRSGGPSPPPSIGRSSVNSYARSESGRGPPPEITEIVLGEHYVALKRFLSQTSRDGKPNPPANKARDKLQRLTSVQFLELSTDVFDELIRRQAVSRRGNGGPQNGGPPAYLLPEDNFHPKRNQARQKLASLGPPRFRDLATDVFCELERRIPRFIEADLSRMNSPASMRPQSRSQTPVSAGGMNGGMNGGFPPRGQSRRRPSEAGSVMSMRSGVGLSGLGPGIPGGGNSVPPSPGIPPNNYDRPLQKQLQSNTIVPNKSTMVEEDDDAVTSPLSDMPNGAADNSDLQAEKKKLIDDYEAQLKELRNKMENMEQDMKRNKDELDSVRSRSSSDDVEKQEWQATQRDLEAQLQVALDLNDTLQQDMDRIRSEQSAEERQLRAQISELQQSLAEETARAGGGANDAELTRENDNLRQALREQQQVTEEVRGEAQGFLREMRMLSQQSGASYEKHTELEKTIETLEAEVREWRNRYARSKTQQRSMRASSMGVPIEEDAGRYVREQGFTTDSGLVKDVHVTKFQIAVDELLRRARTEEPERTVDSMKAVVVSVRRITKDMDDAMPQQDSDSAEQLTKLKTRVSGTANNLITAAKNYSMSAGLSPVSLLDAAASHLVASVVELLRTVKIRTTPANELEEDDEGSITPVESNASFFSPRSNGQTPATTYSSVTQNSLPPPPPFQGLGGIRDSGDSSAYSPISSPRESVDRFGGGGYANGRANGANGMNGMNGNYGGMNGMNGMNKAIPAALNVNGNMNGNSFGPPSPVPGRADERTEDLKSMLDDQTATMVQIIQDMVGSIRSDAPVQQITGQINDITNIVGKVLAETEASGNGGPSLDKLASCQRRLIDAGDRGEQMYAAEASGGRKMDMRSWTTSLPPIAFEIARETKELVKRIDRLVLGDGEDFS